MQRPDSTAGARFLCARGSSTIVSGFRAAMAAQIADHRFDDRDAAMLYFEKNVAFFGMGHNDPFGFIDISGFIDGEVRKMKNGRFVGITAQHQTTSTA